MTGYGDGRHCAVVSHRWREAFNAAHVFAGRVGRRTRVWRHPFLGWTWDVIGA